MPANSEASTQVEIVIDSHLDGDEVALALKSEIEARSLEMPLLPTVAAEVLASTQDDQTDAVRLAELIQQDQALASHLLRFVNSPAFRGSSEIVTLQQAIARLGLERLRDIALSVSLKGSLFKSGPHDALLSDSWHQSLRTALWSKEVARAARKNVEVAYLCGLLNNVGLPLIVNRACELDPEIEEERMRAMIETFGRAAGIMLMEAWSLPSAVSLVIRFLGDFAEAQNAKDMVAITEAGVFLAQSQITAGQAPVQDEDDDELSVQQVLMHPALQHLNFYPDDVASLLLYAEAIDTAVEGMV